MGSSLPGLEILNDETGVSEIEDICEGNEVMEEKEEEKYLGDVISRDGKNIKNVKARVAKGTGIVNRIMTILEGIPFGKFYFEVAVILRNSLLVSSMLCNSESWYNVTKPELDLLETVDVHLLRRILKAPKSTPKEMLYLELGCVPLRELIRKRRISFCQYILKQSPSSMLYRFLESQLKGRKPKDWISQVLVDIQELKLNLDLEEIKLMKKSKLKSILNNAVKVKALEELNKIKASHSKVEKVKHNYLEMQKYLKPNDLKMTKENAETIFKMRSRVTEVKINYRGKYETLECDLCSEEEETQEHILKCKEIIKETNNDKELEYSKLLDGNMNNQLEIAKIFTENMKRRKKLLDKK